MLPMSEDVAYHLLALELDPTVRQEAVRLRLLHMLTTRPLSLYTCNAGHHVTVQRSPRGKE